MPTDHRRELARIKRFDQLVAYLRDEMHWPIEGEDFDDITFDYEAEELGIDAKNAAKIQSIKRLRPLSASQPWGIFFVKFEPKRLPVVALRRILSQVALKKRASANKSERQAWAADDLLFVSNYGEGEERRITFAHFAAPSEGKDLPTLKVLGWDNLDTALRLDDVARELTEHLAWPDNEEDVDVWREQWRSAFQLRHREVITTSQRLSEHLAELARNIRDRIKAALAIETETGPLTKLMNAFQTSLVHDLDADGFADMYSQTIAYGLLSARIVDPHKKTVDDFAGHMRTNPFLKELMETFIKVGGRRGKAGGPGIDFDELGVSEVVELLDQANMEAVVRDFGDRNPQHDPVIHFYEHFLSYYDPGEKKKRGVFYTPRPVVSYIVRSVDQLLRSKFCLADGLADTTTWGEMVERHEDLKIPKGVSSDQDFVQILDPATGTGTFLVEVIDLIHSTMIDKWKAQGHGAKKIEMLWNEYVPKHLLPRLHGYELLMAPYAIAHLKIGLKLYETGYHFGSEERARVYLTNALEPVTDYSGTLEFAVPALAHEVQAVNHIKANNRFTVIIGNPPYSSDSQNRGDFAIKLVDRYKRGLGERKINLDDDYIKFLAFSEYLIRKADIGIVGIITNNTYIDGITLRAMRREILEAFYDISIADLHGSSAKKERTKDGSPDENVFDIEQGVCIALLTRRLQPTPQGIEYYDIRGSRPQKNDCLLGRKAGSPEILTPQSPDYFLVPKNLNAADEWLAWQRLSDIMKNKSGFMTQRDEFVIDNNAEALSQRIQSYFESQLQGEELAKSFAIHDYRNFSVEGYRRKNSFDSSRVIRCLFRPFDFRYVYYEPTIVQQASVEIMKHLLRPNIGLIFMRQVIQEQGGYNHFLVTRYPADHRCMRSNRGYANVAPLFIFEGQNELLSTSRHSNLSETFRSRVKEIAGEDAINDETVLAFMYAIFYSSAYRVRYAEHLKIDFPRIPCPRSNAMFKELARRGRELVALHLMESPKLEDFITTYPGPNNPEVGRVGWSDDAVWLDAGTTNAREGQRATKPGTIGFKGVPEAVWDFHIGGYQVCHKWLKDRKGRTLSDGDVTHYQRIVVALSETIRIMGEIDEVIEQHGGWPGAFVIDASVSR